MNLGYACINNTLGKQGNFKTITVTSATKLSEQEKFDKIQHITRQNFSNLYDIIKWNIQNNVKLYRVSSNMCPLYTHDICNYDFMQDNTILMLAQKIKLMAKENNIRLTIHPDQFNVINSTSEDVFLNTIRSLEYHYKLTQLLGIEICCIHVGGKTNGIEESKQRFINNFYRLPQHIQNMIYIENDDKSFNVENTLDICEKVDRPMILDFHHNKCLSSSNDITYYLDRIIATWYKDIPKAHLSSGKNKDNDRSHAEYITQDDFNNVKNIWNYDLMLECKAKELSLLILK